MKDQIDWNRSNVIIAIIIGSITILLTSFGLYLQYRTTNVNSNNLSDNIKVNLIDTSNNNRPTKITNKPSNELFSLTDSVKNRSIDTKNNIQNKKRFKKILNNHLNKNNCQNIDSAFYNIAEEIFTKILKCEIKPLYGEKYFIYIDEFTDHTDHDIREGNYYSKKFKKEFSKIINSTYKITNVVNQWDIEIKGEIFFSDICSEIIIEAWLIEDLGNTIITSRKVKIEQIHRTDSTDMPRPY